MVTERGPSVVHPLTATELLGHEWCTWTDLSESALGSSQTSSNSAWDGTRGKQGGQKPGSWVREHRRTPTGWAGMGMQKQRQKERILMPFLSLGLTLSLWPKNECSKMQKR